MTILNPHVLLRAMTPALMLALSAACEKSPSGPGQDEERAFTLDELQVSAANSLFGLPLFREIHRTATRPNVLISPLSASMALGMTANGAEGETLQAMRTTLGFGNLAEDSVNAAYRGLISQLRARDRKVEFTLANSIWHERTFGVEDSFLDIAREYFDAEVRGIDFRAATAPRTISEWAEDATGGRIRNLIQQISPLEILFLVNAVYFKAPWSTPFDPGQTRPGSFTRSTGTTVTVPMMSVDATRPYLKNSDIEAVELIYADSGFSMVVILPAAGKTLDDVVSALSRDRWQALTSSLQPGRLILTMPKFKFEFGQRLDAPLKTMGMGIAFDKFAADFDRISRTREDLYISRVEHKTFIDVHELGTEAAAATAVVIGEVSLPPSITIDRPFMFAIRERSAGTLLFIGRVGDPSLSN